MYKKSLSIVLAVIISTIAFSCFNVNAAKKIKAKSISITKSATIKKGSSKKIKCTLKPKNVSVKKVKWQSSNAIIATVSSKGKITAKKSGIVKITASTTDGTKRKATCTVRVLNKNPKASVKKNLTALKDYIQKHGDENRLGQKGIFGEYKYDDDESECTYSIRYNSSKKVFELSWYDNDNLYDDDFKRIETSVSMEYSLTGYDYCTARITDVHYDIDEPTASYSADATIETAKYNRDKALSVVDVISDTYGFSKSNLKKFLKSDLSSAMTDWNYLLESKLGFSFAKIGFTSI